MYYDANGRPAVDGDYSKIGETLVLRHGRSVRVPIAMMDSRKSSGHFFTDSAQFNDAERALADSPEGRVIVSQARASHQRRHAYLGDQAPEFTDTQAAGAIRSAVAQRAGAQALIARTAAEVETMKAVAARDGRYSGN